MKFCRLGFGFLAPVLLLALASCSALTGSQAAQADRLVPLDPRAWPTQARPSATPRPSPFPRVTLAPAAPIQPATPAAARAGALTPATQATASPPAGNSQAAPVSGQVNQSAINLRGGPGTSYAIEGGLAPGAKFTAQATNPARDWLLVTVGGRQGWVEANLVTLNGDTARLPQATPMPAAARPTATPTAAG